MHGGINPMNFLNIIAKHFCEYFKKEASFAPLYPRAKFASKHTVGFLVVGMQGCQVFKTLFLCFLM